MNNTYQHYKGGLYKLLHEQVIHSETGEIFVCYKNLETGVIYIRPEQMFFESVDENTPRFKKVEDYEI